MKARHGIAWRVAACALAMKVSLSTAAPGSSEVSRAERMLFVEHHLQGLRAPTTAVGAT